MDSSPVNGRPRDWTRPSDPPFGKLFIEIFSNGASIALGTHLAGTTFLFKEKCIQRQSKANLNYGRKLAAEFVNNGRFARKIARSLLKRFRGSGVGRVVQDHAIIANGSARNGQGYTDDRRSQYSSLPAGYLPPVQAAL
ncbi:hypothetical protein EVAR_43312_1 [Eumeta japonica]|uniref:Uncharacterized protein n=1 Tax=Eumeta variegata TaxID=151549 RepID=A0A4C1WZM8_EUMVA|nr:hypothetical protein EVAR_43312_1 [Eumeta japonica]